MRFALAHKLSTYSMVLSAFFALALSGQLGVLPLSLAFAGVIGSWFWEPRARNAPRTTVWTVLSLLYLLYSALNMLAGQDVLLVGTSFLTFLVVVKLFNRRELKDYLQIYVLSFLMIVASTVLNAEITYGLFFLGYVISATWALIIFHLRKELEGVLTPAHRATNARVPSMERVLLSKKIVGPRFFLGTGLVSVVIFVLAALIFLLIPRIGFGLFFDKGRSGITMAGFHDGVELGGHGLIKDDDTVVMRVRLGRAYRGRAAPALHWRGVAFDSYSGGEWRRSRRAPRTERALDYDGEVTTHYLLYDQPDAEADDLEKRRERALRQEIFLEPLGYDVLFAASMPVAYEFEDRLRQRTRSESNDEIRRPHSAGIRYVVYSHPAAPSPSRLRSAQGPLPDGYEAYLQIPEEIPDRVHALATRITKGLNNNYDRALALQSYLRSELGYTLQMQATGHAEPIDHFLFERKRGHCEYFSSAMAIMARSLGIPARNVNGFLGGEWNEYSDYIAVRAGDAHSWVELYFPGQGWVTFDPTPSANLDRLGRGDAGFFAEIRRMMDTLRFKWFQWVIEYDLHRQTRLFKNFGSSIKGGAKSFVRRPVRAMKAWLRRHLGVVVAVFCALAALVVTLQWRRRKKRGKPAYRRTAQSRRSHHPIASSYRSALRAYARRGHRRSSTCTPREFAQGLVAEEVPGSEELLLLTELYYRAEYGGHLAPQETQKARSLGRAATAALKKSSRRKRPKALQGA